MIAMLKKDNAPAMVVIYAKDMSSCSFDALSSMTHPAKEGRPPPYVLVRE